MQVSNVHTQSTYTNFAPNNRLATLNLPTQDVFTRSLHFSATGAALRKECPTPETTGRSPLDTVFNRHQDIAALQFLTQKNIKDLKGIKNGINNFPQRLQPEVFEGWLQVADALRHVVNSAECVEMSRTLLNKLLKMKQSELQAQKTDKPNSNDIKTLSRIYRSLAKIHKKRGQIEAALNLMESMLAINRNFHDCLFYGAILHYDAKEWSLAKESYLEALALAEKDENKEYIFRCCLCLGDLSMDEGNGVDAIQYYQRAHLAAPNRIFKGRALSALNGARNRQAVRR